MRLRTIGLISTVALTLLLLGPIPAEAGQPEKVYRIGYLRSGSGSPSAQYIAFQQRLHELGYIEGQNLVLEYRSAEGKRERRPEMAAELVGLKVDVIVTSPAPPLIRAAQSATRTIPIVMAGVHIDPVEAGFVRSLARPGGNITGLTNFESKLHPKRLELLKEAFPRISRVAILWTRGQQKQAMKDVQSAGQALGILIQPLIGSGRGRRLDQLLSAISRERADGLLVGSFALTRTRPAPARIIEFTTKKRLPTIYAAGQFVEAGGLMSYDVDREELSRQTATYVDKILKGAMPGELPIEQPKKFELAINLKTAKALNITFPSSILYRADKVIR